MSENRQRKAGLRVRCTEEEQRTIQANAEAAGLSVAGFLRMAALGVRTPRTKKRKTADAVELERAIIRTRRVAQHIEASNAPQGDNELTQQRLADCMEIINFLRGLR